MKKISFIPATLCCDSCGKPFEQADHLTHNTLTGKTLCACCSEQAADGGDPQNSGEYIFVNRRARLLACKKEADSLPDGCYEIRLAHETRELFFTRAIETKAQRRSMARGTVMLKKTCGSSALWFGNVGTMDYNGLPNSPNNMEYIDALAAIIGEDDLYLIVVGTSIFQSPGEVAGIACLHKGRSGSRAFNEGVRLPVRFPMFLRKSVVDKEYEENFYCKKLERILKTLTPKKMLEYISARIIGQGSALKSAVYLVYRYLRSISLGKDFIADNWMLTAPSGAGKTEFFRAVKDMFREYGINIPVAQIDLSQITESGYKGNNCDTIIKKLASMNKTLGGYAVCFLDEADKKFRPSISSAGNNVNAAVQSNLLTMIEGIEQSVEVDDDTVNFDTSRTMFVFMGAFQEVRDQRMKKAVSKGLGFGSKLEKHDFTTSAGSEFYGDIDIQDMIDYGMLEEIAGRIVRIVNFGQLSESDMAALVRDKIKKIGEEYSCTIKINSRAIDEIVSLSYGSIGIRQPINRIKQLVQDAMAEADFGEGFNYDRDLVLIKSADHAVVEKKPIPRRNTPNNDENCTE